MEYIDEHHAQPIRLAELSALLHMSPYHFARLFTRTAGVPPHQFVVRRRIDAARALLTTERIPIAVIARAVGFRTASHFTTTFRRFIGVTPSAYRRRSSSSCRGA
jgi:AraC family transcriptional regulator